MKADSIIKPDGNLNISIQAYKVTWFKILEISRVTNSEDGGWNFVSDWRSRGLDVISNLASVGTLSQWTIESLFENEARLPRNKSFQLNRDLSVNRGNLSATKTTFHIVSENSLNFALFSMREFHGINLLGYEIPLTNAQKGQLKIDLFGMGSDESLQIIEIKDADGGDSPLMAFIELVCYGIQILRSKQYLMKEAFSKGDGCPPCIFSEHCFEQIGLNMAAPQDYWKKWLREPRSRKQLSQETLEEKKSKLSVIFQNIIDSINKTEGLGAQFSFSLQTITAEHFLD